MKEAAAGKGPKGWGIWRDENMEFGNNISLYYTVG